MTSIPRHTATSYIMTTATHHDDEDSGDASDHSQKGDDPSRKRKAVENTSEDGTQEKVMKRERNRAAAKKCRARKIQEREELKKRNEELEKDNCELVRQREELRQRCNALEDELRHHKEQGCTISTPSPYHTDISQILDPSTPPSPSFAGSRTPSSSSCSSPELSVGQAPVSVSASQTYKADPVLAPVSGRVDSAGTLSVKRHAVKHQTASTPANGGQIMSTERSEMQGGPVSSPAASQPATPPIQKRPQQPVCLRVRLEDGSPKDLFLSEEDYVKVVQRIRAVQAASTQPNRRQNDGAAAVHTPAPQKQPVISMPQAEQEEASEPISCEVQSVTHPTKAVPVQNPEQHVDLFSTDPIDESMFDDLLAVNPNDIFMPNEQMIVENDQCILFPEIDSGALNREVENNRCSAEDLTLVVVDQQQLINADTLTTISVPDNQSQSGFQTEKGNKLTEDSYSPERLVANRKSVEPILSVQMGQNLPSALFTADCTTSPCKNIRMPSNKSQDAPEQLYTDKLLFAKHVFSFPIGMDQAGGSEYHKPIPDSLLEMKTVKIRPNAAQLAKTIPSSGTQVQRLPHVKPQLCQDGPVNTRRAVKNQSDRYSRKDALTLIPPPNFVSGQQILLDHLPAQNVRAGNSGQQLKHLHQVAQLPVTSSPRQFTTEKGDGILFKADGSAFLEAPAQKPLLTASTLAIAEYLELNSMEVLETT